MLNSADNVKEWLELSTTKAFLSKLDIIEIDRLKAIVISENKDEACGIVKGIILVKSFLESAKEDGL